MQDRVRVDFDLPVGTVSEKVEVTAATSVLQSASASLGDVIDSKQVTEMPLPYRDYTALVALTTGIAKVKENPDVNAGGYNPTNGNAGGNFVASGTRGTLNNFLLDGIDNNSNDNAG